MKAKCINNKKIGYIELEYTHYLTSGKIYDIKEHDALRWLVLNNIDKWEPYKKVRFQVIEESDGEKEKETEQ